MEIESEILGDRDRKIIAITLFAMHYIQCLCVSPVNSTGSKAKKIIPNAVKQWFQGLGLLQSVPFNYLVPDEGLLPPECIRFFCLDSVWIDCLQDGAFSVGRVTKGDLSDDKKITELNNFLRQQNQTISGMIMRSQVVSGWPSLLVDGYDQVVSDLDAIDSTEANLLPPTTNGNLS